MADTPARPLCPHCGRAAVPFENLWVCHHHGFAVVVRTKETTG